MPSNSKDDFNIKIRYRVIRRPVKYARLELRGRELWIIIPEDADPMKVIRENRNWVKKQTWIVKQAEKLASTLEIVPRTRKKFRALVKRLIEEYSEKLGVEVNKVYIRKNEERVGELQQRGKHKREQGGQVPTRRTDKIHSLPRGLPSDPMEA